MMVVASTTPCVWCYMHLGGMVITTKSNQKRGGISHTRAKRIPRWGVHHPRAKLILRRPKAAPPISMLGEGSPRTPLPSTLKLGAGEFHAQEGFARGWGT
jgi:hypothetical protein